MMRYQICDFELESNIHFPELLWVRKGRSRLTFRLVSDDSVSLQGFNWIQHRYASNGHRKIWLSIGRSSSGYLLRFPQFADFILFGDCRTINCRPARDIPIETLRHLFLDQVVPLVLQHQHRLVLHAGAVVLPQGAISFLGPTGFGKSTLTASLAARGYPLLTDDCLVLEEWDDALCGIPSYPCLRLWPQNLRSLFTCEPATLETAHYSEKKRVVLTNGVLPFSSRAVPVRRIFVLSAPEASVADREISIHPLTPSEVFIDLIKNSFHLDSMDRLRVSEEIEKLSRLSTLPIFYKLNFPRELGLLPSVHKVILSNLET